MGQGYKAICSKCGLKFWVNEGGGMLSVLFHCNKCGKEKWVDYKHTMEYENGHLTDVEYDKKVLKILGMCKCGGKYTANARPRCPKCKSTKYKMVDPSSMVMYD